jgi:hypothetical protein
MEAAGASVYRVVLAWAVVIVLIVLISKTRAGYAFVYYSLVLMLLFLILTQYQFFQWALAPITSGAAFQSNGDIQLKQPAKEPGNDITEANPGGI